jgi:hypothetical protein
MSLNIATELVAHVAAYLSGREAGAPGGGSYWGRGKKSELLALRVASKHCRDAVRRAVKTHASCEVISLAPVDSDGYSDGKHEIRMKSDPRISSTATSSTPSTRSGTSSRNAVAAWGS